MEDQKGNSSIIALISLAIFAAFIGVFYYMKKAEYVATTVPDVKTLENTSQNAPESEYKCQDIAETRKREERYQNIIPAGTLDIEKVKTGDHFGIWTVKKIIMKPKTITTVNTGEVVTGMEGQIFFEGFLEVSGKYSGPGLYPGILLFLDEKYHNAFPYVIDSQPSHESWHIKLREGETPTIAFFDADKSFGYKQGRAIIVLNNLSYQTTFCDACDPYNGFAADISQILSRDCEFDSR